MASLGTQLGDLGTTFGDVAAVDPISALMLAVGAVLVFGASGVLGYLALGAAVDLVVPDRIGRVERPRAREID